MSLELEQQSAAPPREGAWPETLPTLSNESVLLREVHVDDAPTLLRHLSGPEVSRYTAPPPATVEGFERYIRWAQRERSYGRYTSFSIIPHASGEPVGVIQIWRTRYSPGLMEWGGVIDHRLCGGNLFTSSARLLIGFAFDALEAHRLEARICVDNEAGNAVMRKLGATREAVLRGCLEVHGEYRDHVLWSILRNEWRTAVE